MSHAFLALRHMGFGETETKRALATVRSHVGRTASLDETVRAGLAVLTNGMSATA